MQRFLSETFMFTFHFFKTLNNLGIYTKFAGDNEKLDFAGALEGPSGSLSKSNNQIETREDGTIFYIYGC